MADRVFSDGYKDVGYEYMSIDVSYSLIVNQIFLKLYCMYQIMLFVKLLHSTLTRD